MLQPRERTLPVFAGEVFDADEAGRPVQEPAFQPKLARVGDHAAIRLRRDVHPAAALYRRVVDPAYASRGVLDDPGHGLELPDGAIERQAVAVLAKAEVVVYLVPDLYLYLLPELPPPKILLQRSPEDRDFVRQHPVVPSS